MDESASGYAKLRDPPPRSGAAPAKRNLRRHALVYLEHSGHCEGATRGRARGRRSAGRFPSAQARQPPDSGVLRTVRASRTEPSLHVRALRAGYEARCGAGRDTCRCHEGDGRPHPWRRSLHRSVPSPTIALAVAREGSDLRYVPGLYVLLKPFRVFVTVKEPSCWADSL